MKQNQTTETAANETMNLAGSNKNGSTLNNKTSEGVIIVEKAKPVKSNGTIPINQGSNNTKTQNATTSSIHNPETNKNTPTPVTITPTTAQATPTTTQATLMTTQATNAQHNETVILIF